MSVLVFKFPLKAKNLFHVSRVFLSAFVTSTELLYKVVFKKLLKYILFVLCLLWDVWGCYTCVGRSEDSCGIGSLLPSCGSQGLKSGFQVRQQDP